MYLYVNFNKRIYTQVQVLSIECYFYIIFCLLVRCLVFFYGRYCWLKYVMIVIVTLVHRRHTSWYTLLIGWWRWSTDGRCQSLFSIPWCPRLLDTLIRFSVDLWNIRSVFFLSDSSDVSSSSTNLHDSPFERSMPVLKVGHGKRGKRNSVGRFDHPSLGGLSHLPLSLHDTLSVETCRGWRRVTVRSPVVE